MPINRELAEAERNGWENIDRAIRAPDWTPEQRAQYDAVGQAMVNAADRAVRLVKVTPHRAMRELYEQFIAYSRAYNDAIATYEPVDNYLAAVVADTSSAIANICATISYEAAQAWAPLVPESQAPTNLSPLTEPGSSSKFLTAPDGTCGDWEPLLEKFQADTAAWDTIDAAKSASEWTDEQLATAKALAPVIESFADEVEDLGRASNNTTLQDFASLAAQYRRAFVEALPSYTPANSYLSAVAVDLTNTIFDACKAVGA
jgi:hypothetical protein